MKYTLGMVEVVGLVAGILVADTMAKAANVEINDIENTKGLGYITIKITGDVGAVKSAISVGKQEAISHGKYISSCVISRMHESSSELFIKNKSDKESLKTEKNTITRTDNSKAKKEVLSPKEQTFVKEVEIKDSVENDDKTTIKTEEIVVKEEIKNQKEDITKEIKEVIKEDVKTETLEEPKDKNQIVLKEVKTSNATKGKKKKL